MSVQNSAWTLSAQGSGLAAITQRICPIPSPKAHEVLVRIHAVSLNFRDYAITMGAYPLSVKPDVVLGSDMAGVVIEVGEGVSEWKKGDRVTTVMDGTHLYGPARTRGKKVALGGDLDGVLQEYRIFEAVALLHVPKHLSCEEAACLPTTGVTAWNAFFGGGKPLLPGDTVLFQGTGGVSMTGLMIAAAAGAKTIITSSSDEKLELAKKLGATHTINYKTHPDYDRVVLELTNNVGAHRIFDNVGINEIEKCLNCVAAGGVITSIGFLGGPVKVHPDVTLLAITMDATVRGVLGGSKQLFQDMLRFVESKDLRPYIDKIIPFEEMVKGIEYIGKGQHCGKVVIKIAQE